MLSRIQMGIGLGFAAKVLYHKFMFAQMVSLYSISDVRRAHISLIYAFTNSSSGRTIEQRLAGIGSVMLGRLKVSQRDYITQIITKRREMKMSI